MTITPENITSFLPRVSGLSQWKCELNIGVGRGLKHIYSNFTIQISDIQIGLYRATAVLEYSQSFDNYE